MNNAVVVVKLRLQIEVCGSPRRNKHLVYDDDPPLASLTRTEPAPVTTRPILAPETGRNGRRSKKRETSSTRAVGPATANRRLGTAAGLC